MEKLADIITPLKPHQQRVVDRIQTQPGLVVAHGVGSGKSLSSIAAAESLGGKTTVLAPAALGTNYRKEIAKHTVAPRAEYSVDSMQRSALARHVRPSKLLVVDEAHRLRDSGTAAAEAVRGADAEKRLLLTGTAVYNRPHDLASLVNIAAGSNVLPADRKRFDEKFIKATKVDPGFIARVFKGIKPGETLGLQNQAELGEVLRKWVDYHENSTEGFPARSDHTIEVPLSKSQQELYSTVVDEAPAWVKHKIKKNLPPSKAEAGQLNAFLTAARQVSTSEHGFNKDLGAIDAAERSPKIITAVNNLKARIAANPEHRAVVYSNYLGSGLEPYSALLTKHGIPHANFTGDIPKKMRDQAVADYNAGKLKALLLSSAGGEGLDLKGTRQIQVLEPHFNKEKLEQVIGRGIRFKSHEHLPEDQRHVDVEHYHGTMPEPGRLARLVGKKRDTGADEYLAGLSESKDQLNQQVKTLLKKEASMKQPFFNAFASSLVAMMKHDKGEKIHASWFVPKKLRPKK